MLGDSSNYDRSEELEANNEFKGVLKSWATDAKNTVYTCFSTMNFSLCLHIVLSLIIINLWESLLILREYISANILIGLGNLAYMNSWFYILDTKSMNPILFWSLGLFSE